MAYFPILPHYIIEAFLRCSGGRMEREQIYNIIRQCNMHRQKVLGVCMRYFGFSIDDAEDCVQEAFFSLYDNLAQGKEIQTPMAWIYKVAVNQGKRLVCAQQQKGIYNFSTTEEMEQFIENVPYNPDLLDLMITDDEIQQQAVSILSALNDKERTLYILHYRQKLKLKEIAKHTGSDRAQTTPTIKEKAAKNDKKSIILKFFVTFCLIHTYKYRKALFYSTTNLIF